MVIARLQQLTATATIETRGGAIIGSIKEPCQFLPYIKLHHATGHTLTSAAIVGLDVSEWASSSKFPEIKPEEVAALLDAFNSDGGNLAQRGLFIGGAKYLVIQGEQGVVIE
ncbi:hypothetical protein L7F22_038515 [Adiantum nelumboides]|nr:hypothetical protein [Adiantum nelumboides]